jgi:hypothetical protein
VELTYISHDWQGVSALPKVSEFFGIVIYFFYNEHLPSHFHAQYGGAKAMIGIDDLVLLKGNLPPRVLGLVVEWALLHREDLRRAWGQARANEPIDPIEPLR